MAKPWGDNSGETGRMYEAKFMGKPTMNPEFLLALDRLPQMRRDKYEDAVFDLFKKHYDDDPLSPSSSSHLRDLRIAVADILAASNDDESNVRAYSTVGTVIDIRFGTDGFIEYTDPKTGKTARATIDVTLNTRKHNESDDIKADVLVGELPDAVQDEDAYLKRIDQIGGEIASILMKRTAPEDQRKAA